MVKRSTIEPLEILSYVDGHLDEDPARKAELEERLRESPRDMARVRAFLAQNEALRHLHEDRIRDTVPDRLYRALEIGPDRGWNVWRQAAAALAMVAMTGSAGWYFGQRNAPEEWSPRGSIERAYREFASEDTIPLPEHNALAVEGSRGFLWLSDKPALSYRIPDLSARGFAMVESRTLMTRDGPVARLTYAASSGASLNLFVRARWEERKPEMSVDRDGDVSVAYWQDGPFASALVSELSLDETQEIAKAVRVEMLDLPGDAPLRSAESASGSPNYDDKISHTIDRPDVSPPAAIEPIKSGPPARNEL